MATFVTESIWHFTGHLHIAQLLHLASRHYTGAPKHEADDFQLSGLPPDAVSVDVPEARSVVLAPIELPAHPLVDYNLTVATPRLEIALPGVGSEGLAPLAVAQPPSTVTDRPTSGGGDLTIHASYEFGEAQGLAAYIRQANALDDRDTVSGTLTGIDAWIEAARAALDEAGAAEAATAFGRVEGLVPTALGDALDLARAAGVDHEHADRSGLDPQPVPDLSGTDAGDDAAITVEGGSGRFSDGRPQSPAGQSAVEQIADIEAALARLAPDGPASLLAGIVEPKAPAAPVPSAVAQSTHPDGLLDGTVVVGANTATNVAVLNDLDGATASRIIVGDYRETNLIVQINAYTEVDAHGGGQAGAALHWLAASAMPGPSDVTMANEASFVGEPGPVDGLLGNGGPGTTAWRIDSIRGDVYDVTVLDQQNRANDGDAAQAAITNSTYVMETGDNDQLNLAEIADLGNDYELIIVAGDWIAFNAIFQMNVVANDSHAGDDGDRLLNDAAIVNIGGKSHLALTPEAEDLVAAIADGQTEFDHALAIGLPGNGDGVFDVLYVTGDFLTANIVLQTNIVMDADVAALPEGWSFDSGSNDVANLALIQDVDSLSDYQMVGGEIYEETLVVQAALADSEGHGMAGSQIAADATIHPDVIASIAAMVSADDAAQQSSASSSTAFDSYSQSDVLGGVLA